MVRTAKTGYCNYLDHDPPRYPVSYPHRRRLLSSSNLLGRKRRQYREDIYSKHTCGE